MVKGLIHHITEELKSYDTNICLLESSDRFLYRADVREALKAVGVELVYGSIIQRRIHYELRDKDGLLVLLSKDNDGYLEDIKQKATAIGFSLVKYFNGYHIPSIIDLDLKILDKLFQEKQLVSLNRKETLKFIQTVQNDLTSKAPVPFDLDEFIEKLSVQLEEDNINWSVVCRIISNGILKTVGNEHFDEILVHVNRANTLFQQNIKSSYQQIKNSSAVKKPRIVSKILDYLNFNYRQEKIALIVVDGLAFWQYELLKAVLPATKKEEVIYSWLPSITQLSRQAIFRGGKPEINYRQGPTSEKRLWKNYWKGKGVNDFEIRYKYEDIDLSDVESITKLAIVFKDLDEKMHSSTDYKDLLKLTENWVERSRLREVIGKLQVRGFAIFLTTDHGNIQAKGWRSLQGREKLGTNKSGSRSERHIEYTEKWLTDEFMVNNPGLKESVALDDQAIYFTSDLSFSRKETLMTHGGAHLLEVLIPFIQIKNE